ncbi:zinc finger BED domain-containing protein RICESLEEPER 2-like [Raphanus sativus]|uniref:Zinc finger BED domain-containing protein RICESLEEPER 2-like n=1 Tax=Raphanus sativus TaxID=3726 RepID=A0A9W3DEP3_RAPSA|nr:zinc finger BED domain-containing protein RICESLEEPER 2-like [Raphanus sativus]
MQKRIISFQPVTDHKGETIAEHLSQCLEDWGIKKVFTVTVATPRGMIRHYNLRDGLAEVKESLVAIRNAVKYVRSSGPRLQSFQLRVLTGKVSRGSLSLDCTTRWNSTYLMLCAALKFRVAFEKLLAEDMLYNDYFNEAEETGFKRVGPPTSHGWDEVQSLSNSRDGLLQIQAREMRNKFEKYWDGLIIIASVFDPRNKMQFACICFDKLYGKKSVESSHLRSSIRTLLKDLYEEYAVKMRPQPHGDSGGNTSENVEHEACNLFDISDDDEEYEGKDSLYSEMESEVANDEGSSELDIYLMERPVPRTTNRMGREFDVLSWWSRNSAKYPVLSDMVKDVIAIQVSSVASESAFSTSGSFLDPYRSCLTPYMIEALRVWNYQDKLRTRGWTVEV